MTENAAPVAPAQDANAPAPSSSGNPPVAAATPAPAAQPSQAGAQPAPSQFSYPEDRSTWVPPHRLRETSARIRQMETELHYERQRVAALSGVQAPAAPEDPETAAIRAQFEKLYPGLAKLNANAERIAALAELDPQDLSGAQEHYWESLGNMTLRAMESEFAKAIGADKLGPKASAMVRSAFSTFVAGDPENRQRYAQQDPSLISDFIQEYRTGVLDPFQRSTTAAQAPRAAAVARLPRGGNSSAIPGPGPAKVKPADTDEFHGAAFRALTAQQ